MYLKILVPLDGSPNAETILPHVEKLARAFKSHVILLNVDDAPDLLLERDEVVDLQNFLENRRVRIKDKETYFQSIIDEWKAKDIAASMEIRHGSVVSGIMDCAKKEAVDLVAMVSHGTGGTQQAFYGSVTAGVLSRIDRPLLLIRSKPE